MWPEKWHAGAYGRGPAGRVSCQEGVGFDLAERGSSKLRVKAAASVRDAGTTLPGEARGFRETSGASASPGGGGILAWSTVAAIGG